MSKSETELSSLVRFPTQDTKRDGVANLLISAMYAAGGEAPFYQRPGKGGVITSTTPLQRTLRLVLVPAHPSIHDKVEREEVAWHSRTWHNIEPKDSVIFIL